MERPEEIREVEVTYGEELRAIRRAIADGRIAEQADAEAYTAWGGSLHLAYQRGDFAALLGGHEAQALRARPVQQAIAGAFQHVPAVGAR